MLVLLSVAALLTLGVMPSGAITGGQADGGRHPYVGGMVMYWEQRDETIVNCTGSLISRRVFLTAAHCGRHQMRSSVSFDEVFDPETSPRHEGTFLVHPDYDPAQWAMNDLAVIVLDTPLSVDLAVLPRLPQARLLDRMRAEGTLNQHTRFTAVGYGVLGFRTGDGAPEPVGGMTRNHAVGSYDALDPDQLHLSQNAALGDGGTCNGDSGGPNFIGSGPEETPVIAGITSVGDTYCKATNVPYRLDTAAARSFLGQHVALP